MSNYYLHDTVHTTALNALDIDSASGEYIFAPGVPVDVYKVGFVVSTAITHGGSGATVDIYKRPDPANSGAQSLLKTWTIAPAVAGKVPFTKMILPVASSTGVDGSHIENGPAGPVRLNAGQAMVFDVNSQGTAGAGYLFIEFIKLPFTGAEINNAVES